MLWRSRCPSRRVQLLEDLTSGFCLSESRYSRSILRSTHQPTTLRSRTQIRRNGDISRHRSLTQTSSETTHLESAIRPITVAGIVRSIRKQKKVAFAHISDGSTLEPIQAILSPEQARDITNGSYVELHGNWTPSPAKGQAYELQVDNVARIGESNPDDFPIQKKSQTTDFLRSIPHLRFRTPFYSLLARARSQLTRSVNDFYINGRPAGEAIQVHPPLVTSSDCEGAGEVFTIYPKSSLTNPIPAEKDGGQHGYFRDQKYLTVSTQLHLEAYSAELGDVWTLSPTFRAEESDTPRHLSEFYMLEAEFRSLSSLAGLMAEAESLVKHVVGDFAKSRVGSELLSYYSNPNYHSDRPDSTTRTNLSIRWSKVTVEAWTRISYAEAIKHLESYHTSHPDAFVHTPSYATGLQLEHERHLVHHIANDSPLFVTDYPRTIKPFYMLPSRESTDYKPSDQTRDTDTVACFDLLFPFGTAELIGGSLREHRLPNLIQTMREKGLIKSLPQPTDTDSPSTSSSSSSSSATTTTSPPYPFLQPGESLGPMQWYADLRRFGSAPHGGFGLGFDRLLAYLTGVASVRDTVGFPRYHGRADC